MLYNMFREHKLAKLCVECKVYNLGSKQGFTKEMETLCNDIAKTFFHILLNLSPVGYRAGKHLVHKGYEDQNLTNPGNKQKLDPLCWHLKKDAYDGCGRAT